MPFRFAWWFVLLALAPLLSAQSSVWKVTRDGRSFFLGGTIHLLRAQDFPLPAEFDQALAASAKLVFETDIARVQAPETQQALLARGMFMDGRTLQQVLSPAAWKVAQDFCAKAGLPIEQLGMMKPWLFALTMALVELQKLGVSMEGVDLHLHKRAREAGKTFGELEDFEKHLDLLVNLGGGDESAMIEKSVDDLKDLPRALPEAIAAWRSGNLQKIDDLLLRDTRRKYPKIHRALLADRNAAWVPKLEALLATPEVEFVLVGAGHLPGPDGLMALLKARGCAIEPVRAAAAAPAPKRK
jgi:hypothetical protein